MDNTSNFSNESKIRPYMYLDIGLQRYFLSWYLPIVIIVGFVGSIFCLLFITTSKLFRDVIKVWLISICVADLIILLTGALRMMIKIWTRFDMRDEGAVICKLHNFLTNYALYWSAYNQTAMSLQRLYFVVYPLHARSIFTLGRVVFAWLCIALLCVIPHLPYLLYWGIHKNEDCEPSNTWYYYVTTVSDLSIWGVVPLATMTIATLKISHSISAFSRSQQQRDNGSARCDAPTSVRRHGGEDNSSHVTRLLVVMNLFYMSTTCPLLVYIMYLNFGLDNQVGVTIDKDLHKFFYYFLRSLCYLNSSMNWMLYCAAGKIFRKKAKRLCDVIMCRKSYSTLNPATHSTSCYRPVGKMSSTTTHCRSHGHQTQRGSEHFESEDVIHLHADSTPC